MKKICYVVPYFGKLPKNFPLWLKSCEKNETINWLIYTDDRTEYNYPSNFKIVYCSFEEMKLKIQRRYNFLISISRAWKLCDFKVAYGEIFSKDLENYDFWGYCDVDLMFGDIRKFITDDILCKYDKIGFQGHSTLYKNTPKINSIYKTIVPNLPSYKEIFSNDQGYCFDENIISDIFTYLKIPYYNEVNFAHLSLKKSYFYLAHFDIGLDYKNNHQVFVWDSGKLYRFYTYNKKVYKEEFMYIHFFVRPMTFRAKNFSNNAKYIIHSDYFDDLVDNRELTYSYINRISKHKPVSYICKRLWRDRKKISPKTIIKNIKFLLSKN